MQFQNITNTFQQATKNLKKQPFQETKKTLTVIHPLDQLYYRFDWLELNDEDIKYLCNLIIEEENDQAEEYSAIHNTYPISLDVPYYPGCLKHHSIDEFNRMKLFIWIGSTLTAFEVSSNETYFLAITILDKFFKLYSDAPLKNQDLYGLGIACIALASKMIDIYALSYDHLQRMSYEKFSLELINDMQITILRTLDHRLDLKTIYHVYDYLIRELEFNYKVTRNYLLVVSEKGLILLKYITLFYDTTIYSFLEICFGCIYYTIQRLNRQGYKDLDLNLLESLQSKYNIQQCELILRLIYKLCSQSLDIRQRDMLDQMAFKY